MKPALHGKLLLDTNTATKNKNRKRKLVLFLLSIKILLFFSLELHAGWYLPKYLVSGGRNR